MLVAVRHNRTSFNEDGKERLRGWLNIPLSKEGKEAAIDTARKLDDLSLTFDSFHTSPLRRALETADAIENEIDMNYTETNKLKDWNTGIFTGKFVEPTLSKIHYYMDHPEEAIPEGESFNSFYNRTHNFLKDLVESDKCNLAVTHNRTITLLKSLCKNGGKDFDKSTMKKKGPIEPGGIMMIEPDWSLSVIYSPKEVVGAT